MAKHDSGGYRGAGLKLLSKHGVTVGDSVKVATEDGEMSGVLMPRYESASYFPSKMGLIVGRVISPCNPIRRVCYSIWITGC